MSELKPAGWEEMINVSLRLTINMGATEVATAAGNMAAFVTAEAGTQGSIRALVHDVGKHAKARPA